MVGKGELGEGWGVVVHVRGDALPHLRDIVSVGLEGAGLDETREEPILLHPSFIGHASQVARRAAAMVAVINGLLTTYDLPGSVSAGALIDRLGNLVVVAGPAHLVLRGRDRPQRVPPTAVRALDFPRAREALTYMALSGEPGQEWFQLYKAFEAVEKEHSVLRLRLATRSERKRFKQTANAHWRHAEGFAVPAKPMMTIPEAQAFVSRVLQGWLEMLGSHLRDPGDERREVSGDRQESPDA